MQNESDINKEELLIEYKFWGYGDCTFTQCLPEKLQLEMVI